MEKFESGSRNRTRSREEKSSRRRRSVNSDDGHKRKKRKEITREEIEDYMARKAQKKAMRIAKKLKTPTISSYSNNSNPFGDTNLNEN